jgi:hypothetical protein
MAELMTAAEYFMSQRILLQRELFLAIQKGYRMHGREWP